MNKDMNYNSGRLMRQLYFRLLPVQILTLFINTINVFIDSLVISRYLGTEAMAAIGLFTPVATVLGTAYVLIRGVQVLCSNHLGRGDAQKVSSLFSTCAVILGAVGIGIGVLCLGLREQLAGFLGAQGSTRQLLADYISGYSIGIAGQMLSSLLLAILPLNDDSRISYIGTAVLIGVNVALDFLFACCTDLGTMGMGLATSFSYLLSAAVLFTSFFRRDKLVRFRMRGFSFRDMPAAVKLGTPSLMFNVGCTIKAYVLNSVLLATGSMAAVAAMSVQSNVCSILGAIPCGASNIVTILGGVYCGEEDRVSLRMLANYSLWFVSLLSLVVAVGVMACSSLIPGLFYPAGTEAWEITRRMLLLFPGFLVFNSIFNIFNNIYQCQGRVGFVNMLTFAENVLIAAVAAVGVGVLGTDAVWLAFPIADILCLMIIALSVFAMHKRITFSLMDWMKLRKDFGVPEQDRMDMSVNSLQGVINISERIIEFCRAKDLDEKKCMVAGLSVEEMAGNIVRHGIRDVRRHMIDIRISYKNGGVTIRMRDNCKTFDPINFAKRFQSDDPAANIGIRMIMRMAKDIVYLNNIGMNVLLIKI